MLIYLTTNRDSEKSGIYYSANWSLILKKDFHRTAVISRTVKHFSVSTVAKQSVRFKKILHKSASDWRSGDNFLELHIRCNITRSSLEVIFSYIKTNMEIMLQNFKTDEVFNKLFRKMFYLIWKHVLIALKVMNFCYKLCWLIEKKSWKKTPIKVIGNGP